MSPKPDIECLADALQMLGKLIQDSAAVAAKERAPGAIQSITRVLEQVGAEMDRNGPMSKKADISLTLYAARELERYLCGEKTDIHNRRIAEVYYRVLCSGIKQLPRSDQDLNG
jgi:hypothetical protein